MFFKPLQKSPCLTRLALAWLAAFLFTGCPSIDRDHSFRSRHSDAQLYQGGFVWNCGLERPTDIARPAVVCGRPGFNYLMSMHFANNCRGCHYQGSIMHPLPLADADGDVAYQAALSPSREEFISQVTNSRFLTTECLLAPGDPIYDDFMQWVDMRESCPQ